MTSIYTDLKSHDLKDLMIWRSEIAQTVNSLQELHEAFPSNTHIEDAFYMMQEELGDLDYLIEEREQPRHDKGAAQAHKELVRDWEASR